MPISVIEFHDDVVLDDANKDLNGVLSYDRFNRLLWRAMLRMIDWLTGKEDDVNPPQTLQKNRDFLSPFIVKHQVQIYDGVLIKPADFYTWNDMYFLRKKVVSDTCDEDNDEVEVEKVPIEILESSVFNSRVDTWIEDLKPKNKTITKLVGRRFEFEPKDVGSITLEYIRYPIKPEIVTKPDPVYNDEIPDPDKSVNIEFDEQARNYLAWFLVDLYANNVLSGATKQLNTLSKP